MKNKGKSGNMKKAIFIGLFLSIVASCMFTGCGNQEAGGSSSETSEAAVTTEAEPTEAETEEATEAETEETTEAETEAETEEATEKAEPIVSDIMWVDFDNMTFSVNGKTYKLGETTLQEMIDDGVPFDEDDLANAGNNTNPNYETPSFNIELGEYKFAQVSGLNDTSENKPASECYISEIYMPIDLDEPQDILEFNFPFNITKDDLITNSGEPEDPDDIYIYDSEDGKYHKETYTYKKSSEKYYGNSYYKFEFLNGGLDYITINYMP